MGIFRRTKFSSVIWLALRGKLPLSLNLYRYLNPISFTDPTGLQLQLVGATLDDALSLLSQFDKIAPGAKSLIDNDGNISITNRSEVCEPKDCNTPPLAGTRCLCDLIDPTTEMRSIFPDATSGNENPTGQDIWPHNAVNYTEIHVPVESRSKVKYGFYVLGAQGLKAHVQPYWRVTAHELCGHAWWEDYLGHGRYQIIGGIPVPVPDGPRGNRPQHDSALGIENTIVNEVDPGGEGKFRRPYFNQDPYHGESVGLSSDGTVNRPEEQNPNTNAPYPTPIDWGNR